MLEQSNMSEMNMAVLTLSRIHESLYNCNQHQRDRDYKSWFYEMMVLMGEASASMNGDAKNLLSNEEELKTFIRDNPKTKDDFIQANLLISKLEPLVNKTITNAVDNRKMYMDLFYLGIFIKAVLKKGGVLMRLKEDARFMV